MVRSIKQKQCRVDSIDRTLRSPDKSSLRSVEKKGVHPVFEKRPKRRHQGGEARNLETASIEASAPSWRRSASNNGNVHGAYRKETKVYALHRTVRRQYISPVLLRAGSVASCIGRVAGDDA